MENQEVEEKVMIMEELIQGFIKRINGVEIETQTLFKSALVHYKETLSEIGDSVKKASQTQENNNFTRQIEEVKILIATLPKVFTVKNNHYFGAWSKSFIIGITIAFLATAASIGTALYLNKKNNELQGEAFRFWLVKALYPKVTFAIETGIKNDYQDIIKRATSEIDRNNTFKTENKAVGDRNSVRRTKKKSKK